MKESICFKNKEHFVNFVKKYFNISLENDVNNIFNQKRNVLYTYLGQHGRNNYLKGFLEKEGIRYEEHSKGYYWVYIK